MRTERCLLTLFVAALPSAAGARDTNPMGVPVGHRAIGLGGAYTAIPGDGVSLWYNPAGLGSLPGGGISANVTVYQWRTQKLDPFVHFGDANENHPAIEVQGDGTAESSDFSTVPSSLVISLPLGEEGDPTRHGIAAGLFVPDADDYVVRASRSIIVPDLASFQLKARDVLSERTYWVGAGYGYDAGTWALGLSGFGVAHLLQRAVIVSVVLRSPDQNQSVVETREFETTDISAVAQIGGLYRPNDRVTLGLSVRSPSLGPLYTQGQSLIVRGNEAQGAEGFIDRLETEDLETDHQQALRVTGGVSWRPNDRFMLTADLQYVGALGEFEVFDAPLLCPPGADQRPVKCDPDSARTVSLRVERERAAVINVAVGSEIQLTEKMLLRLGAYTDRTAVDDFNEDEPIEAQIDIYSGVVGIGYRGERGSTDLGLLFRYGTGETISPFNESGRDTEATLMMVGLYLAGSANM